MKEGNFLTRGEVAKRAEVGIEAIRFYEQEGLIEKPPRKKSGYRQYTIKDIRQIRFIKKAKQLGFSLKEISGLLSIKVDPKKGLW